MVSKQAALRAAVPSELREWVDNRLISAHIRMVRMMVLGTLLNALVIAAAFIREVPPVSLALFGASMLAAGLHRVWLAEGIERGRRRRRTTKLLFAFRMNSWWLGLNIGIPMALWLPQVSSGAQLLLAICAMSQIASAAYSVRTMPWAATVYVVSQTLGLAIGLAQLGSVPALGAIVVLLTASGLLIRMAFVAHDLFITRILADRDLATASRTVKLLLNEYEENGSDWLFELDAEQRLTGASRRFAQAAGISAMFILVNSIAGLAGNYAQVAKLPSSVWFWIAAAVVGGIIGSTLGSQKFNSLTLRRVLAAVLLFAGVKLIFV